MLGQDQAQVIDAGRRWWSGRLSLRYLAVHVPTNDERNGLAHWPTFPEHVHARQILRVEAQLDAAADQCWIDRVAVASQRDRGGAGDPPHDRPAERLAQQRRLDGLQRSLAAEAGEGRLAGFGMHTGVAHLLGPGQKTIVQLGEAGDAVRLGLGEKAFADKAIEALLLAAPLG